MQKVNTADIIKYLKDNWQGRSCPMCDAGDWNIQAAVFQLIPWGDDTLVVGSPNVPVVPVICTKCGNTILISAKVAGLVNQ